MPAKSTDYNYDPYHWLGEISGEIGSSCSAWIRHLLPSRGGEGTEVEHMTI